MTQKINGLSAGDWALLPENQVASIIFNQINSYATRYASGETDRVSLRGTAVYLGTSVRSKTAKRDGTGSYFAGNGGPYLNYGIGSPLGLGYYNGRLQYNITGEVIDTLDAKVSELDVIPQAVTNRATAQGRQLAENLNFLTRGVAHTLDVRNHIRRSIKSAMINNMGFVKVVPNENTGVTLERVHPDEIIIDPADGYYNNPQKMLHRKLVPIEILIQEYPEYTDQILTSNIIDYRASSTDLYTPSVLVAEGWVKNTYKKGGRHLICIENCVLVDEKWDKDYFPVLKVDYIEPEIGHIGPSVVDILAPIQQELDRFLAVMQKTLKLVAVPRVFIDTTSQVNVEHITNDVGSIVRYNGNGGNAPIIHNGSAIPSEMFRYMDTIIARAYARVGLSSMDTQGLKPAGIDSGEALKTLVDIQSQRWDCLEKIVERKTIELFNIILGELRGRKVGFAALDNKLGLVEVSTDIIPKDFNTFVLQHYPVSAFPQDISGRIDTAEKMMKIGVLEPKMLPEVFDMPDISSLVAMKSAPYKYIETIVESIIRDEKYVAPEEFNDLDYAEVCATQHYNFTLLNGGTEKAKKLLRRFISETRNLKKRRDQELMIQNQEVQQAAFQQAQAQLAQQQKIEQEATKQATAQLKEQMQMEQQAKAQATEQLANTFAQQAQAA